jgi:uncharacterized heparinase superfamily protein
VTSPLTYWRTIRHLRLKQIFGRLRRLVPSGSTSRAPAPGIRRTTGSFGAPILRPGPMRRGSSFHFLNRQATVADAADWNTDRQAKLWVYNLHYFDWLREEDAPRRVAEDEVWLDRWIADNPLGHGAGWEPYPLSLRIVNWIVWLLTIGSPRPDQLNSLAIQVRHLARSIEYHLLGNHLFANAKALSFAGSFFEGPEADGWRHMGLDLLDRELREQVLADGAHFELSPMYHALVLEDVLDLLGLGASYPDLLAQPISSLGLNETASRMTRWLIHMLHPDGQIPYFNDAAFGIAPSPVKLLAYAASRGIPSTRAAERSVLLQPSGYAVLSSPPLHVIFDCGRVGPDYLPGHAHADTLSFELSIGCDRIVTNSGTSTYAPGPDREWERSTPAHATVEIDGVNSAETWASFRVGRRPNVGPIERGMDGGTNWIECWHDGYRHLAGRPVHRRRVAVAAEVVHIADRIEGTGRHNVAGFLPLHPAVHVAEGSGHCYRLRAPEGHSIEVTIDGPVQTDIRVGRFAPEFGVTVERPVIEWRWSGNLPLSVQTQFRLGGR